MKLTLLFTSAILVSSVQAQTGQQLPNTLPQLAAVLPALVHAGKYQRGPFSDAVDEALRKEPSSAIQGAAICARNLGDPEPQVRIETLAVLHAIAITPQGPNALKPINDQLAHLLLQEDEWSQRLTLLIVTDLKENTSDSFIDPLEQLMRTTNVPDRNRIGAASALALARPTDLGVQNAIVNVTNDASLSSDLRSQIISFTATPYVGVTITDNVVHLANTSTDKEIRDAAISAATKIGPDAITKIKDRLIAIQNDTTESLYSHRVASSALRMLH